MLIHLDTSFLVAALTANRPMEPRLRKMVEDGNLLRISAPVLYEWLRGPRKIRELEVQEALFPRSQTIPLDAAAAEAAARIYKSLPNPRGREVDIVIAACAVAQDAALATLNPEDFRDIPKLTLA